jgi:hypothetical protein
MGEVQIKFGWPALQLTYTAAEPLVGGQVVERRSGSRVVGVAGAGSLVACGVARHDVPAARTTIQTPQVGDGGEALIARDCVIPVTFAASATEGQKLVCAANGQVTPAGATPDARTIIGEAFEAVASGAVGKALIY